MGDQTKNIQTLSIEGSIEHRKHNQLDIKYLHQLFIRNPQLWVFSQPLERNPNLGFNAQAAPLATSRALFSK